MAQTSRHTVSPKGVPLRICLAGSGGGHVRQLLDMEPLWRGTDYFFVTEPTALGKTLQSQHDVEFVEHVALGQARLGAPVVMLLAGIKNLIQSARIVWRRRPDVVISTGAGATFFTVLCARLLGAKVILIDSMARIEAPSAFARIAGPLAHVRISQSEQSSRHWPGSVLFDSLRILDKPRPDKEPLLFATVGATLPFDRLIEMVDVAKRNGAVPQQVIAQTGINGRSSDQFDTVEALPFDEVKAILRRADIVVCHGGTGSLVTALQEGCKVIAVPRRFARGEHYDDHQYEITSAFAARGLILTSNSQEEFDAALVRWQTQEPIMATRDTSEMVAYMAGLLEGWSRDTAPAAIPAAGHD
jgi:UDP-N-acetylglucosamine--N-acetylmuramyl-(pentapeptide) pyrophosphoryl-undecaprenol N-acetylglucosamine transferase